MHAEGWGGTDGRSRYEIERDNEEFARRNHQNNEIERLRREVDELKRDKRKRKKQATGED